MLVNSRLLLLIISMVMSVFSKPLLRRSFSLYSLENSPEIDSITQSTHTLQTHQLPNNYQSHQYTLTKQKFQNNIKGKLLLAPLTRGGNGPFRRLCGDFGADYTMSEMAYARNLYKGVSHGKQKKERVLARRNPTEKYFGFQIAANSADDIYKAVEVGYENKVTWMDLNCGCPIKDASRRNLGATMLKHPGITQLLNYIVMRPNLTYLSSKFV